MSGMRFTPKGYGGHRRDADRVKRDGWQEQQMLAVSLDDHRLTWPERELVRSLAKSSMASTRRAWRCDMSDDWTRAMVADRLDLAADVMRSMPPVRPQGFVSAWPDYVSSFADQVGQEPRMKRPLPSPRMITQADEAMLWLRWVDKDIGQILWARANRKAWKGICWQHGISRATASRRQEYGLAVIVWRLNGRTVPRKRSMDYVIQRTA